MQRIPVSSSDISSVGYEAEQRILEITFHKTGPYIYYAVPIEIYNGLLTAESKGKYFYRNIKLGPYPYDQGSFEERVPYTVPNV